MQRNLDRRLALGGLLAIASAAAGLALLVVTAVSFDWQEGARAETTTVIEVGDIWFCDSSFENGVCDTTVNVGDTVEWQWVGGADHTTTACSGSDFATCDAAQGWNSPVQSGGSFTHSFTTAGTFYYYKCLVHPGPSTPFMRGKITVAPAAEPSPSPQVSPTPSPTPTPVVTPASADLQPTAVPVGGGAPPAGGGTPMLWWLTMAAGGFLVASSAALLTLRGLRR